MNFVIITIQLILLLTIILPASHLQAKPNYIEPVNSPITIAVANDLAPYCFVDRHGQVQGLVIDYWKLWATKVNENIKFVSSSWLDTVTAVNNNTVDIHSGILEPDRKLTKMELVAPMFSSKSHLYIRQQDRQKFTNSSSLSNKIIGLIRGTPYQYELAAQYPSMKFKIVNHFYQLIDAMENNQIDGFVNESLATWHHLLTSLKFNRYIALKDSESRRPVAAATALNRPKLQQLIIKGINKITREEVIAIEQQWISPLPIDSAPNLSNPNSLLYQPQGLLSAQEQQWLLNHSNIEIGSSLDWMPFAFTDQTGRFSGFNVDLLNLINNKLNTTFSIKRYRSWPAALAEVKSGELGGIFSLSWSKERAKVLDYSPVYFHSPYQLITRNSTTDIYTLDDLKDKRIAVFKGFEISKIIKNKIPSAKLIYIDSTSHAYPLIAQGHADALLVIHTDPQALAYYRLKVVDTISDDSGNYAIGTSKQSPMLGNIISKGINAIGPEQLVALKNKWLKPVAATTEFTALERQYILNNPVVTVGISEWEPILFSSDGKAINGIVGDFLSEITTITGLSFRPKMALWHQLLSRFKQHKIDLLPNTFYSDQRATYGIYGDSYFDLAATIFVRSNNNSIKTVSGLAGLKVAITKSSTLETKVKKHFPEIKIIATDGPYDSVARLLNNEIDAIIEMDVVLVKILRHGLIQGIKAIRQSEIAPEPLHFFSRIDRPILHSILKKSLSRISKEKKQQIIEKWLGQIAVSPNLNIAIGINRPPYTLEKKQIKGLEHQLINQVLAMSDITVNTVKKLPISKLATVLSEDQSVDAAVTIAANNSNYYYSDPFISFSDVAISRKKDHLKIKQVADLKQYSVAAFDSAYKSLGLEFFTLYNPQQRPENYLEYQSQNKQVNQLLQGKSDVLIMDNVIFNWFANRAGYRTLDVFEVHPIFPKPTELVVGFRSKTIRDLFNRNLAKLKANNEYSYIYNDYISGKVSSKAQFSAIIASVVAKFIFDDNHQAITSLGNLLSTLSYVTKIEILTNDNKIIFKSTPNSYPHYQPADSYHLLPGKAQKVGQVRIYFDEEQVTSQLNDHGNLIPEISFYQQLPQYRHIWSLYGRFDYLEKKIYFTEQEKSYLLARPTLKFSEIDWQPLSIIDNNQMTGFIADHLQIITDKTGLQFEYVPSANWLEVISLFNQGKIDLVPSVIDAEKISDRGIDSIKYASFDFAIVMRGTASYVDNIAGLKGKKIAVPRGYTSHQYIKENYPSALVIETFDIKEALSLVRNGQADAFVGHMMAAAYRLENEFSELKLVGIIEYDFSHRVMVHQEQQVLLSIINKAIQSMTPAQHREIRNRWFERRIQTATDYNLIYQILAVFTVILVVVLFVVHKLSRAKKLIEDSRLELEQSIVDLHQAQQKLIESEKMASLGGLVAGISHEINTPVGIGLTAASHFIDITKQLDIQFQQQTMSQSYFKRYLASSVEAAQIVNRNLERTAELVKSFKLIAVDQSSDERRSFNVDQYVHEILISVNHLFKNSNLKIEVSCDKNLRIDSYPGTVAQIISNLLINSSLHAYPNNEDGLVKITITNTADVISLTYTDDGQGIPPENLSKIFEPFFTTNREHGGSGLGLNIIYNLVTNKLNGKISCHSKLGHGTEFSVEFNAAIL